MSLCSHALAPVLETLAADSSTEFGVPGARIELLRRFDGPFSTVQRVRIQTPARTTHAYIKVIKPYGPGDAELARADRMLKREYLATCAVYERLEQDAEIGALRPIGYLPAHHALATEEVPGRPLGEILAGAIRITDELRVTVARVGAWTRIYQAIGEPSAPISLDELRSYADHRLVQLEGRVISTAHRQAVLARFDALARQIGSSVPGVPIHADLGPMNIIVDENGRVTVIDFTMAKTGTALHDLSHVFFHLELMASQRRGRRAMFRSLQRAMIAGYDTNLSADDPLFRLMLILHSVCHVAMLAQRRVPLVDVAYRWFLRRRWHICEQMPFAGQELQVA